MALGNWGENLLRDAAGDFFGSEYLRDYTHASKTFRANSYEKAPKFKFLFHTYFEINPEAYSGESNFGVLVKEVKLPAYSFQTVQLNQYNRKRIIQTKIKYEPIEIKFHDDNGNNITKLWEAYYRYYYNDGSKPGQVLQGARGNANFFGGSSGGITSYNDRNIYNESITGDDDWGFYGGQTSSEGKKVPFFKNITVFGFNQHDYTAYTLVNPIITSFGHDTYSYNEGGGVMENRMTIDYETVVYNYGNLDGREPGNIVTGFGDEANYDRNPSPIAQPGSTGRVLGQGGLVDAAGGAIKSLQEGDILGAIQNASAVYNGIKNPNLVNNAQIELTSILRNVITNTPNTRNSLFSTPVAGSSPGPLGTANSPTVKGLSAPPIVPDSPYPGQQYNGQNYSNDFGFPVEAPFGSGFNIGPTRLA